jgi:hypothetical protein
LKALQNNEAIFPKRFISPLILLASVASQHAWPFSTHRAAFIAASGSDPAARKSRETDA